MFQWVNIHILAITGAGRESNRSWRGWILLDEDCPEETCDFLFSVYGGVALEEVLSYIHGRWVARLLYLLPLRCGLCVVCWDTMVGGDRPDPCLGIIS